MGIFTVKNFKWLPNALTFSRAGLGIVVLVCALNLAWVVAFWVYLAALLTDFLDGLAAKKLHAYSKYGMKFDSAADGILAAGGVLGLGGAGQISWWIVVLILLAGFSLGSRHYLPPGMLKTTRALELGAKVGLFVVWILIAWHLAGLAHGWHWWYVLVTMLILATAASLKRHRLRAWLGGKV